MKKNYLIYIIIIIILVAVLGSLIFLIAQDNSNKMANFQGMEKSSNSDKTNATEVSGNIYSSTDVFTNRDLEQTADLTDATNYTLASGEDIHITEEGVYVLTGTATNSTVYVEAQDTDKVQIVLDGVSITNDDFPCIYAKTADKVFITTTDTENTLVVANAFTTDGDVNTDGVIFSKSDITLNGTGSLNIESTDNGIVGKDDLKITGGTYNITATSKTIEANDSIAIADGIFNLKAGTDGLHSENSDDDSVGYIFITGGEFTINAGDDGIHGQSVVQIDGGSITITAAEGIEGTYIQINGGTITINASDDGINAADKSSSYFTVVEINDGDITITMGAGDTDGVDANGDIIINGGTISVTGNSTFDYDGEAQLNGGTVIVNGSEVDELPNQMMGGPQGGNNKQNR